MMMTMMILAIQTRYIKQRCKKVDIKIEKKTVKTSER